MTTPNREPLSAFAGALNQFISGVPIGAARPAALAQAAILHAYGLLALTAELRTINSNLVAMFGEPEETCTWRRDWGNDIRSGSIIPMQSECGMHRWIDVESDDFTDFRYCPKCGKEIAGGYLNVTEEAQP